MAHVRTKQVGSATLCQDGVEFARRGREPNVITRQSGPEPFALIWCHTQQSNAQQSPASEASLNKFRLPEFLSALFVCRQDMSNLIENGACSCTVCLYSLPLMSLRVNPPTLHLGSCRRAVLCEPLGPETCLPLGVMVPPGSTNGVKTARALRLPPFGPGRVPLFTFVGVVGSSIHRGSPAEMSDAPHPPRPLAPGTLDEQRDCHSTLPLTRRSTQAGHATQSTGYRLCCVVTNQPLWDTPVGPC